MSTTDNLRALPASDLFGPVGCHPWVNDAGKVDAAKAGTWMANIILMAGGSPKTAFACALEVVTDITDNPAKFKNLAGNGALRHAAELFNDIMNDEVNAQDEAEKWLRAYAPDVLAQNFVSLPNASDQATASARRC